MLKGLKRVLRWLCPPYDAHLAQRAMDDKVASSSQARMKAIHAVVRESLPEGEELPEAMESFAKLVFESENERRMTLEGKALQFVSSFGVAMSVILVFPVLFSDRSNQLTPAALIILATIYLLGIGHLMTAVWWSVTARRVKGLALPSADVYLKAIQDHSYESIDRIKMYIGMAKFNEPILTEKANSLWVAETMFCRGLLLVTIAAIISGCTMLFRANATPTVACRVPDVVGLDEAVADGMLLELGLQPIRSNQYHPKVKDGAVIRQDPVAGSLINPCDAGTVIVISLGPAPTRSPTLISTNTPKPTETPTPMPLRPNQ